MSREIKFRVWNKITEQWSKNFNVVLSELDVIENIIINLYTGLKDSEGYEIYEDDIVWNEWDEEYQVVIYDEGEYKLMGESHIQNLYDELDYIDIRGNVYENFELVGGWYNEE